MKNKNKTTTDQQANPYNLHAAPVDEELKLVLHERLLALPGNQLKARLTRQLRENRASRSAVDNRDLSMITNRILDTGTTSTGSVLPRVDLEQTIYALFIKAFPWFERLNKGQSNGLRHTWNVATATGSAIDTAVTATSDLANAQVDVGTYAQQNANIAIFDELRGVSLKELYAVQQSGMSYSPEAMEMMVGTTRIKSVIQRTLFQGNASVAGGAGAATELGVYNPNAFDGLRLITGGLGTYNTNGSKVDQDLTTGGGPFTITQAVNYASAQIMNNGGLPSVLVGSPITLNKLMNEQEGKQRTEEDLIPGVRVQGINTVAGQLPFVYAPGSGQATTSALGYYNRTSDATAVEDLYILDESYLTLRYMGSPELQVIEIPVGVDTQLSRRFIIFGMYGLQVADAGLFQAKLRIPV